MYIFTQFVFNPRTGLLWSYAISMTVNYMVLVHSVFAFIVHNFVLWVAFFTINMSVFWVLQSICMSFVFSASPTVSYYLTLCTLYRIVVMTLRCPVQGGPRKVKSTTILLLTSAKNHWILPTHSNVTSKVVVGLTVRGPPCRIDSE